MKLMIVPARSGSKRVPDKNVKHVGIYPLVVRTLKVAIDADVPTLFTTDSEDYIKIARKYCGEEIEYELRPASMATDTTRVVEEISRICEERGFCNDDLLGLMLPTSPFRTSASLLRAIELAKETGNGVFSATKYSFPPSFAFEIGEDGRWVPVFGENSPMISGNTRSQNQVSLYHPTGGIYVFKYGDFKADLNLYNNAVPLILDEIESLDIDHEVDFEVATFFANTKDL
jgi:CMP-N-acetylneuraminic acid synthetase